ncbi:probable WRKY transcription factor 41 [Phtheirospermum japonicum]|uniref:Probable WRKY transcription factor 41 n=1 Tax=Phtheirospermum japonicum TaxID=374723 RepID=A0A830CYI3_9LAMI|nr:probable WRKY transcription factor 41 [Phtheirospermum japonicum]
MMKSSFQSSFNVVTGTTRMENEEYKKLVNEITKGLEQVKHLRASSSGNQESSALEKMLTSYEEALSILNGMGPQGQCETIIGPLPLPDRDDMDQQGIHEHSYPIKGSKKRKSFATITKRVRLQVQGDSINVPQLDGIGDEYCWRKYGAKDIHGSKYPRGYYRCNSRGCPARKHLQRLDDDPSVVEIVYNSTHTCVGPIPIPPPPESSEKLDDSFLQQVQRLDDGSSCG